MPPLLSAISASPICQPMWINLHRPSKSPPSFSAFPSSPTTNLPRLRWSLRLATSFSASTLNAQPDRRSSGSMEIELEVRDYELDQYGVVNNAVYANYCQHGRDELFKSLGTITPDEIARSGESLAMSELSYKFLAPLQSGDKFVVKVRISGWSNARFYCEHLIYKLPNHEPVLEANGTVAWLGKNYRPVRIPKTVRSIFATFVGNGKAG